MEPVGARGALKAAKGKLRKRCPQKVAGSGRRRAGAQTALFLRASPLVSHSQRSASPPLPSLLAPSLHRFSPLLFAGLPRRPPVSSCWPVAPLQSPWIRSQAKETRRRNRSLGGDGFRWGRESPGDRSIYDDVITGESPHRKIKQRDQPSKTMALLGGGGLLSVLIERLQARKVIGLKAKFLKM